MAHGPPLGTLLVQGEIMRRTFGTVGRVEAWLAGARVGVFQRNAATAIGTRSSRADVSITVVNACTAHRIFRQPQQPVIDLHL